MKTTLLTFLLFTTILFGQCPDGNVTFNSQLDVNNFIAMYPNCDNISGDLLITGNVTDLSALNYLVFVEGDFIIRNTQLTTISNFNSLALVLNSIEISNNSLLTEIIGFNVSEDFPFNTQIYVRIIPYNSSGQILTCQTERFTTKNESLFAPTFFTPNSDGYNDNWAVKDPLNEIEVVYI